MSAPAHLRKTEWARSLTMSALAAIALLVVLLTFVVSRTDTARPTPIAAALSPSSSPTSASSPSSALSAQAVTFAFGGDIHFEGGVGQALARDAGAVLAGVRPVLEEADVAMANLETAVTTRGTAAPGKEFAFRAPPRAFDALAAGGIDVVTMANNHGLDYGPVGLDDSLAAAKAKRFPVVGIGHDAAQAFAPWTTTVKGQRIAVFGVTHVIDTDLRQAWSATDRSPGLASAYDTKRLVEAIRHARATADTVVVYVHWGTENETCPNAAQPKLAATLVGAGADIVVGSHAHRLQGAGMLGSAFVAYGLGNFAFYRDSGPGTESGVLTVTATGRRINATAWHPAVLVDQLPRLMTGASAEAATRGWEALKTCTRLR
jgi:hypothetical protein